MVRRMFPGGNTSRGFYSYYQYIIPEDANRRFILKGGPGVGKSSFMRRIAKEALQRGFDVEMHHCSSDNNSLDGIVIPALGVAFMDGTAPHIVEPRNPGCVDEIIHFGDYWDVPALTDNKDNILADNKEKGRHFARAYRFLSAAGEILDDMESKRVSAMDFGRANLVLEELFIDIFGGKPVSRFPGKERHLFGSAYTPAGFVDHADTLLEKMERVYFIRGEPGTGKTTIMNRLALYAVERGFVVEYFHAPLKPYKLDSIIIPEIKTAVTCSPKGRGLACKSLDLNRFVNGDMMADVEEELKTDGCIYNRLIDEAIASIANAKRVHDRLERYYIPNMDFEGIDGLRDRIVRRILDM